jgi:hypothetical protein
MADDKSKGKQMSGRTTQGNDLNICLYTNSRFHLQVMSIGTGGGGLKHSGGNPHKESGGSKHHNGNKSSSNRPQEGGLNRAARRALAKGDGESNNPKKSRFS